MANVPTAPLTRAGFSGPALRLYELITASWVASAVSAAAELGVADVMTAEPRSAEEIAAEIGADPETLHRLLRACTDLELVDLVPGRGFALTGLGRALRGDAPDSMRAYARWMGTRAERSTMAYLADAVRTGGPVFEDVHGIPVWSYMRNAPGTAALFDRGMTDISAQLTRSIVDEYDFGGIECLVDVGGGHGRLLSLLLEAHPRMRGVLFDRPEVIARPEPALTRGDVATRCRVEGGDFLEGVPAGADAYLLASVVHNWNDEDAARILSRCREAVAPRGRVLLAEVLVPEGPEPAPTATLMDLSMLVQCGGKQRTERQFADLLRDSGFRLERIVPAQGIAVVEGTPA
ncbi:methyltransferase [Nocardiopsis xinjiangensis]|uniref:methyltransferase n=1 Tax=Nocardiopsis xinjiangensis TaxID=124285 RepID=UPI00052769FA